MTKKKPVDPLDKHKSLLDALEDVPGRDSKCPMASILARLDDEHVAAIDRAIVRIKQHRAEHGERVSFGPTVPWLKRQLDAFGHIIGDQALRKHVRGDCSCQD